MPSMLPTLRTSLPAAQPKGDQVQASKLARAWPGRSLAQRGQNLVRARPWALELDLDLGFLILLLLQNFA